MTPGTWLNNPTSITEQWEDCTLACTPIPGQTGATYTVAAGDVGHTIQVVETAVNAAAPSGVAAASARTATASTTSTTSVVAFSQNTPTTNQGVTLVATVLLELSQRQPARLAVLLQWLGCDPRAARGKASAGSDGHDRLPGLVPGEHRPDFGCISARSDVSRGRLEQ